MEAQVDWIGETKLGLRLARCVAVRYEGDKLIDVIVRVVELHASGVEFELPIREHDAIKRVFERDVIFKKVFSVRTWQINAEIVDETEAACCNEAVHGKRLGYGDEVFLLNKKGVGGKELGKERASVSNECCS